MVQQNDHLTRAARGVHAVASASATFSPDNFAGTFPTGWPRPHA